MRRRRFLTVIGGAAAFPLTARSQQPPMPVVGFLNSQSPEGYAPYVAAFRQGSSQAGYVEGRNVAIEYRWARGKPDQLAGLVADLISQRVDAIAATGGVLTARLAIVPIVLNSGEDPVRAGLVSRLNRPGGNVTELCGILGDEADQAAW